ncbi:apolipoprotein D-like [Penaeus chinensis]|uniref:apolipoprotein D-like n=1 Tax=Penaeus chinensis TaxID=139456 RepID=UPI001FB5CFE6|nr:apolipoprotein D-like [Penaeus chinensis]
MSRGSWMAPLALFAALVSGSLAADLAGRYVTLGKCPNITNKADFDAVPYLGRWYEQERYDIVFQSGMDCVNAIYSDMGNGYVEVHNTARTSFGDFTDIVGQAHVVEPGVLLVEFGGCEYCVIYVSSLSSMCVIVDLYYVLGLCCHDSRGQISHILDTDYENYSSVYNCFEEGEYRWQYAWLLTRAQAPSADLLATGRQVFANNGIDLDSFHVTYQGDDCPYLA